MIRGLRTSLLPFAAVLSVAAVVAHGQSVLTHHVRDAVRSGQVQATGRLPSKQVLELDLVLPLRDQCVGFFAKHSGLVGIAWTRNIARDLGKDSMQQCGRAEECRIDPHSTFDSLFVLYLLKKFRSRTAKSRLLRCDPMIKVGAR